MRLIDADMLIDTITYSASLGGIWGELLSAVKTAFITLIKAMPTVKEEPHWIPCSERLPDKDGEYLVTFKLIYMRPIEVCTFLNGQWILYGYERVLAWQPLPEPWKGEE